MEAAFFDLDKTMIAKSSPLALGRTFFREGLIGRGILLRSMYAQFVFQLMGADEEKMERMRAQAASLTVGWNAQKVRAVVTEVLEDVITPLMYEEALELIEAHKRAGRVVCIVSSSPQEIVEPLADLLGIHRVIATRTAIDTDGRFTGELEFYAYGPYKASAIRDLAVTLEIDLSESFAYSDSITDLPMLEAVGIPTVVNPDRELRRIARTRGWQIVAFKNPVSLRSRIPALAGTGETPWIRAVVAAMTCLSLISLIGLWLIRRPNGGQWSSPARRLLKRS